MLLICLIWIEIIDGKSKINFSSQPKNNLDCEGLIFLKISVTIRNCHKNLHTLLFLTTVLKINFLAILSFELRLKTSKQFFTIEGQPYMRPPIVDKNAIAILGPV